MDFPVDDKDFEAFFAMDGRVIHDWMPPVMRMVDAEEGAEEPGYSDFPWLGEHAPILKTRHRSAGTGSDPLRAASAAEGRGGARDLHPLHTNAVIA
jgi:hypothetical protein